MLFPFLNMIQQPGQKILLSYLPDLVEQFLAFYSLWNHSCMIFTGVAAASTG